jgi:integrase
MADKFSAEDVTCYVVEMRKRGRADKTIQNHLKLVEQAFRFAKLAPPDLPKFEIHYERSGFLYREEFDRLMTHLPEDLRDFCLFAYITGWRSGAIKKLEWSDVRDGNVYLRRKLSKNRKPYCVPIADMEELRQLISRREAARAVGTKDGRTVLCSYVPARQRIGEN